MSKQLYTLTKTGARKVGLDHLINKTMKFVGPFVIATHQSEYINSGEISIEYSGPIDKFKTASYWCYEKDLKPYKLNKRQKILQRCGLL